MTVDWLGWVATALVVVSYLTKRAAVLRRIQGVAATLWLAYGLAIHSKPVIVANIIVASAAILSSFRRGSRVDSPA